MNARNKHEIKLTNRQIDQLKILETEESFQTAVVNFRKKFCIDICTGIFDIRSQDINPEELVSEVQKELMNLSEKFKLSSPLVRSQILCYIRYGKWGFDSSLPEKFLNWSLETPPNYKIIVEPPVKIDKNGKVLEYSKTVNLVTFASLSTDEEKEALRELKSTQKFAFNPLLTKKTRHSKNIDRDINLEKEMLTRIPNSSEENMTSTYMEVIKSEYEKGKISLKKFNKIKEENSHGVEIVKKGITSRDISYKIFGSKKKSYNARQINSRIKKKRNEMFGNNL